ncbi:unnamed protein product [Prunus armeniaca]
MRERGREAKSGSARVRGAGRGRTQMPRGCILLDVWAPHTCHVSYLTESICKARSVVAVETGRVNTN